jgi:hypothetical protein
MKQIPVKPPLSADASNPINQNFGYFCWYFIYLNMMAQKSVYAG